MSCQQKGERGISNRRFIPLLGFVCEKARSKRAPLTLASGPARGLINREVNANVGIFTTRKTEAIPTDPIIWSGGDQRHLPRRLRHLSNHRGVNVSRAAVLRTRGGGLGPLTRQPA